MRNILKLQSGTQSGTGISVKKMVNFLENWCAGKIKEKVYT